ncbi:hypothetical protein [Halorubellus litoreus]|uniref:Uncharacterized protein n=1 Tax=Halorubellus litoreus TaxID=755308 RepID=A0ABD5VKK8_9EURY
MKLTTITASYSDRRQRKQYEPIEFGCTLTAELEGDDDPVDAYEELARHAKNVVGIEMTRRLKESEMADAIERGD